MAKNNKSGLTLKNRIGYGCGDAGGVMTFMLMSTFFTRYCLNILGVSSAVLATLLLIWNIWDAVNDPLMGALMDKVFAKHHNKKGKFRPWILRATPMMCVSAIALWTLPTYFEGVTMIAVLFVCKILYEGFYTMLNIPMGSLLSAMANTDEERAQLSSARGICSTIFGILASMLFPIIIAVFGDNSKGYGIGITVLALVGMVLCFLHYFWTEERNLNVINAEGSADNIKISDILEVFKRNRAFLALCIHSLFLCSMQAITGSVGTYMYADVLGSMAMMSTASMLSLPLSLVLMGIAPKIAKKTGLVKLIRYGLLISSVLYLALFGVMSCVTLNVWVYAVWSSVASCFGMLSVQMQWGLVAEAIDYNEYLTGKRTEGSIYGTFSLSRRIGTTIGSSLGVLMLGWTGYQVGAATQSAAALGGIKMLALLVPALFVLGSWVAFKFVWNIDDATREKIAAAKTANQQ